jgi:hypothetical protein
MIDRRVARHPPFWTYRVRRTTPSAQNRLNLPAKKSRTRPYNSSGSAAPNGKAHRKRGPAGKGIIAAGDSRASEWGNDGIAAAARKSTMPWQTYTFTYTLSQRNKATRFIFCCLQANEKHLKSVTRKGVGVQFPLRAPEHI